MRLLAGALRAMNANVPVWELITVHNTRLDVGAWCQTHLLCAGTIANLRVDWSLGAQAFLKSGAPDLIDFRLVRFVIRMGASRRYELHNFSEGEQCSLNARDAKRS